MELRDRCNARRAVALGVICVMFLLACVTFTSILSTRAEEIISKGHVTYGVTDLRIREAAVSGDVITKVDGGFELDIYEELDEGDSGVWYSVGFYLDEVYTRGYVSSDYVTIDKIIDYSPDEDFEAYMDEQGFPESYKDGLRALHAKYPNWVFVADHNGVDWDEYVENQSVIGRSLTFGSAVSSWKSTADGCYDWETGEYTELDSGGWVQASTELIEYALDPRNFLSETYIFMFEDLSYNSSVHNEDGLESLVSGTFMENSSHDLTYNGTSYTYVTGLLLAGQISGVSPYHLASRIIQEQGSSGYGSSISGAVSEYEGYYNYYNIGAYKSGGLSAVQNGLKYASSSDSSNLRPWNSRMKSIIGGAIYLGKSYINRGQNTLYYEKFDMTGSGHQYMTNVLAPRSEAVTSANGYSSANKEEISFVFVIPVYDDMPDTACSLPDGDGSPNNRLESLSVDGYSLTPTFSIYTTEYSLIVDNGVSSINVSADAIDDDAEVGGTGNHGLSVGSNVITIKVTAANGDTQDYTITVVRKAAEVTPDVTPETGDVTITTDYTVDSDSGIISGIELSSSVETVTGAINVSDGGSVKMLDKNGSEKSGQVVTGDIIAVYDSSGTEKYRYTVVIYGDINGDGAIDLFDFVAIKRSVLNLGDPSGVYWLAADCNRDGTLDLFDFVAIKRCILGLGSVKQ